MKVTKTTIYEFEEHGVTLEDDEYSSFIDDLSLSLDDPILLLYDEANQQPMEEPVQYFETVDYYPIVKYDLQKGK